MIKVNKYEIQTVEHFDNAGNSLGFLNELEHNDLLCQIVEQQATGYHLAFNGEKTEINSMGVLAKYPKGLFSANENLVIKLISIRMIKAKIMKENSVVRENLMNEEHYSPFCGNNISAFEKGGCNNPRTEFNGQQFVCPKCGWISEFPADFITRYKEKWNL